MTKDLGFSWRDTARGEVTILRRGRPVATLRAERATKFRGAAVRASFEEGQQLMARWTGQYRLGNERTARNHPRNRRS